MITFCAVAIAAAIVSGICLLRQRAAWQREKHARRMIAARQDVLRARGIDGTHEKCEMPEREELAWERIATRHATFGKDALRRTSA